MFSTGFSYEALPMRVRFGPGVIAELGAELDRLGLSRALVLCSPEQEKTGHLVAEALGRRAAGVLAQARMHVPIEIADLARDQAAALGADWCVAVGGGSAIGLGKAVALEHGLPIVLYDSELTHGLPVGLSVTSGLNAVAHAVESLYAPDCSPSRE
jgi:maleylacetate reductase